MEEIPLTITQALQALCELYIDGGPERSPTCIVGDNKGCLTKVQLNFVRAQNVTKPNELVQR